MSEEYHCAFLNVRKLSNSDFAFVIISKHALIGIFDFNNSEMRSSSHSNNSTSCELVYQSVASYSVIRPRFEEKVYFLLLFAHFVLVHVIKRISNEFSFHTMYYETRCVFYIPSPEARGYKTHNSFHNTSYGMKIHLRSYMYVPRYRNTIYCLYNVFECNLHLTLTTFFNQPSIY